MNENCFAVTELSSDALAVRCWDCCSVDYAEQVTESAIAISENPQHGHVDSHQASAPWPLTSCVAGQGRAVSSGSVMTISSTWRFGLRAVLPKDSDNFNVERDPDGDVVAKRQAERRG